MKVIGFDGKHRNWALHSFTGKKNASALHVQVRKLLKELFPYDRIAEELTLPGSDKAKNGTLYADFFVPSQNLIVEAHGIQHYEFNSHFFKDEKEFQAAQRRDRIKEDWCELNDLLFVELAYKETEDEWRQKIISRITT